MQQVALISIPIIFIMDKWNLILFEAHESKPEDCHVKKFFSESTQIRQPSTHFGSSEISESVSIFGFVNGKTSF